MPSVKQAQVCLFMNTENGPVVMTALGDLHCPLKFRIRWPGSGAGWHRGGGWVGGFTQYPDYENRESRETEDAIAAMHEREKDFLTNNPNDYPENWKEIADHIKKEAGWRCVRCGHPHESPKERIPCDEKCDFARHPEVAALARWFEISYGKPFTPIWGEIWQDQRQRVLTVHHLDGRKSNVSWWNLAALCQVCHLHIQGKVNIFQQYPLEHSRWFKPYVAGFYAKIYLNLELSREEVEDRLNELLELERRI
jgi:hypothetical protein